MMKKLLLFLVIFASFVLIMGCSAPAYQPCCIFANATNETNPICDGGIDPETGFPMVWELAPDACDVDAWACKVYVEDAEGNQLFDGGNPVISEVPICPKLDEVHCNTTCSGVFCGSFGFDPRPGASSVSGNSVYPAPEEGESDESGKAFPPEPAGMWHSQCAVQNITPKFLRHIENSDSITLNTLRFGIGNSFQDFEDAQVYFPITDKACGLNPIGWVDRYLLYAIPNTVPNGDLLCRWGGEPGPDCEWYPYTCVADDTIHAQQYFECAARCALSTYGYIPEIEPYNPYPTKNEEGDLVGNPFAYGPDSGVLGTTYDHMYLENSARGAVRPLVAGDVDDYTSGVTLYGATFAGNGISFATDGTEHTLMAFLAEVSSVDGEYDSIPKVSRAASTFNEPYSDNDYTNSEIYRFIPYYYEWLLHYEIFGFSIEESLAKTAFITIEENPHAFYAWLLSHHSVYSQQLVSGHLQPDGSSAPGAEFECTGAQDCLSGYCNTFDYNRGTCVSQEGTALPCDCRETMNGVVCRGSKAQEIPTWDRPDDDYYTTTVYRPLPAPVSYYKNVGEDTADAKRITMLPSLGTVEVLPAEGSGTPLPILVLHVGGVGEDAQWIGSYNDEGFPLPTYDAMSKGRIIESGASLGLEGDACTFLKQIINPNSAGIVPDPYLDEDSYEGQEEECWMSSWVMAGESDCSNVLCSSVGGYGVEWTEIDYNPTGQDYPIIQGFWRNMADGDPYIEAICDVTVYGGCGPYGDYECMGDAEKCDDNTFRYQNNRYTSTLFDSCIGSNENLNNEYVSTTYLCFSKSAQDEYGLPVGFRQDWIGSMHYFDIFLDEINPLYTGDVCRRISDLADDEDTRAAYNSVVCYEWASGGRKAVSSEDICVAEALAYVVAVPHIVMDKYGVQDEYVGRLAIGNCMLNAKGDDLEVTTHGVCESCGYLTMAKEHLVALPADSDDPGYDDMDKMSYNHYCPNMVVKSPQTLFSLESGTANRGSNIFDWRFYQLGPYQQFVDYQVGSNEWYGNDDFDRCIYPNGEVVVDDITPTNNAIDNPQRGLPYILPNAFYVNQKLESLMVRNVQPVIFADDSDLWVKDLGDGDYLLEMKVEDDEVKWSTAEHLENMFLQNPEVFMVYEDEILEDDYYYRLRGSFLANSIFNEGAAILVLKVSPPDSSLIGSTVHTRTVSTRVLCPNCMTSVAFGYKGTDTDSINDNSTALFEQIGALLEYKNASSSALITDPGIRLSCDSPEITCDSLMMKDVDAISVNLLLGDGDDYCSMDGLERYEVIYDSILEIGLANLQRYGKPTVITDLIIDRSGSCWDEESASEFMVHLGTKSRTLAKAGFLGVIYGDWESSADTTGIRFDSKDSIGAYRGEFYEGMFISARNFAGYKLQTLYNEVPTTSFCTCSPCTSSDDPRICNGHFMGSLDAPICSGYEGGTYVKWNEDCITEEVCMPPEELETVTVECEITYNNGTIETVEHEGAHIVEFPGGYKDVIASISAPEIPCFDIGDRNLSFRTLGTANYLPTPSVFSMDGNLSVKCDPIEGVGEICGYTPPISDYAQECKIVKPSTGMWVIFEDTPSCGDSPLPVSCTDDDDCPDAYWCGINGYCKNWCNIDDDCPGEAYCEDFTCLLTCEDDSDCESGVCGYDGTCESPEACETNADCPVGTYCFDGQCYVGGCLSQSNPDQYCIDLFGAGWYCGDNPSYEAEYDTCVAEVIIE